MPTAPVTVGVCEIPSAARAAATEWLDRQAVEAHGSIFHGRGPDGHVLVVPGRSRLPERFAELFDARVGLSEPAAYAAFAEAHAQAVTALRRAAPGDAAAFADVATGSLLSELDSPAARALAAARLAPLREHDAEHGTAFVSTVRAWFVADCSHEAAAQSLGLHRHTVRTRLGTIEQLLGENLSSFATRAELWAALRVIDAA